MVGPQVEQEDEGDALRHLLFGASGDRRFTQDTPILPDVWIAFALKRGTACKTGDSAHDKADDGPDDDAAQRDDMLLAPDRTARAGAAAFRLREMLDQYRRLEGRGSDPEEGAAPSLPPEYGLAHMPGLVAARLTFAEMMRVVLPNTAWWIERTARVKHAKTWRSFPNPQKTSYVDVAEALVRHGLFGPLPPRMRDVPEGKPLPMLPVDMLWMIRVAGTIALLQQGEDVAPLRFALTSTLSDEQAKAQRERAERIAKAFLELYEHWPRWRFEPQPLFGRLSRNRRANASVTRSVLTVKGDAARRLFEVSTRTVTWAVIDCGIDGGHPAFRDRAPGSAKGASRVVATYDFTDLRKLLNPDDWETFRKEAMEGVLADPERERKARTKAQKKDVADEKDRQISRLGERIYSGQDVDWAILEPFVRRLSPPAPHFEHGTHVAGVLGADWRPEDKPAPPDDRPLAGMCPEIRLIDMRVLDHASGEADEFEIIAAMQFLRFLNTRAGEIVVHGANLSLSMPHDVENYGCGRTPICLECEKAVANGLVVVVAAGNYGYLADENSRQRGFYRPSSITDPGNAQGVLTVGSTHRLRAHEYGVSYFSGRGPTGDGRRKPDLVAPGEKVVGPLPGGRAGPRDGTSMAAPHASGAAALLMARNPEFVGRPERIKQVLCDSATDLGRYSFYQGAGLLDTLRALQSV